MTEDTLLLNQTYTPEQTTLGFVQDVQSYYPYQHTNGGFFTRTSSVSIDGYTIVDADTIELDMGNVTNKDFELRI